MNYLGLLLLSIVLTYLIRSYALKRAIIDIPNERSSHSVPTPRGGGLSIIVVFYIGLFLFKESIDSKLFLALFSALPIAIVSILDDIYTLSSKLRLAIQVFSATLALYFLGGVAKIDFVFFSLTGWWLNIVALISIVWLTNLYNFLDGIDGYVATQTIMVGVGMFLLLHNPLGMVLAVGSLGFLFFNWDRASIFMGDVGSATLGFILSIFIFSDTTGEVIYFWLVMLLLFIMDATVTLYRRYRNGEKITQAHRKHAYQRLTQSGWSHQKVTLGLLFFNLLTLVLLYITQAWYLVFLFSVVIVVLILLYVEKIKRFE